MLIREAVENAEQGFTVNLKNGARIVVYSGQPIYRFNYLWTGKKNYSRKP